MSATAKVPRPPTLNRRRRVRQKVHAPAYASFVSPDKGEMIELYEVLDISEVGVAVQCPSQLETNQQVDLCLDLAEATGQICTPARVIWSNAAGRAGLALSPMPVSTLHRLREWLFLNAMAAAANAAASDGGATVPPKSAELPPNYTDILNAVSAVQREAESLDSDLEAVLELIVSRSQSLLHASGAAIAIAGKDPQTMICRASAGESAPPVGAALHIGAGFSGECVRTASLLRCDDAGSDNRVDRESCRALGIRSMLAAPVKLGERVIGLLEVFSAESAAFDEKDASVLQRFAEMVLAAMNRVAKKISIPVPEPKPFQAPAGSVLFAQAPPEPMEDTGYKDKDEIPDDQDNVGGIRLPRAHLYLLICAAATIFLALGFLSAPWIQPRIQPWLQEKLHSRARLGEETVLASSAPADSGQAASKVAAVDLATIDQLRDMAQHGDAAAEDRLGRLYAEGDEKQGIAPNDKEAARWFSSAAEHGSVSAQYKLGLLYWGGHHGLPKDMNRAYFWAVLARAGGQEGSKDLAIFLANGMTRAQAAAIEEQADAWYRQHEPQAKPSASRY